MAITKMKKGRFFFVENIISKLEKIRRTKFLEGYNSLVSLTKASLADSATTWEQWLPYVILPFGKKRFIFLAQTKDVISTSCGSSADKQLETEYEWGLTWSFNEGYKHQF